jgi:hypothetical protein
MSAGTQSGKTTFEPDWLRREINLCGEGDYLAATATFPLLEKKMLPEFIFVFETAFKLGQYQAGKNMIQFHHVPGGTGGQVKVIDSTRIMFGSGNKPDSMESATAKAAVADECGQKDFELGSWEAMQRRLSINRGRCLFGTTLYNSGWFVQDVYEKAEQRKPDYELIQFDSIMNPAFPRAEYYEQEGKLPRWKFAMFYKGKFMRPAGLVYDSFDSAACKVQRFDIPKTWLIYVGHDFGSANPAAMFYAQDPATGTFYAFYEYLPGQGRSTFEHVQEFKKITAGYNVISRIGGNLTTEEGWRNDYTSHGWHIQAPKENLKRIDDQIQRVYALNKLNKVKVFDDLHAYLDEKLSFSHPLDEKYQPLEGYEDERKYHLLAAERYILSDFTPETVAKEPANAPVQDARPSANQYTGNSQVQDFRRR